MTLNFLWDGRAQPARGPKPTLSLERIADTGIAIADAEGLWERESSERTRSLFAGATDVPARLAALVEELETSTKSRRDAPTVRGSVRPTTCKPCG